MNKGALLELYKERIKVLVNTLPYIALTHKPGTTLADVGIPENADNLKALDAQQSNVNTFLAATLEFQTAMVPYADKGSLITSILYYENMLPRIKST